jgi:hypothetical protein
MPLPFNALCILLKSEVPLDAGEDLTMEDAEFLQNFENAKCEIANTISVIASEGILEIKEKEASLEDKMIYGR